jgi:hypothetical protein
MAEEQPNIIDTDPWLQRPMRPHGDPSQVAIFCSVGLALTLWETVEGGISVAYVGLIESEKYRLNKYFSTASFEKRHAFVKKAIELNVNNKECTDFGMFIDTVLKYRPRRHEIAHGRVCNLGEYGFYLAPSNVLSRNYPDGAATYQYTSEDIGFYCGHFEHLAGTAEIFAKRLGRQ